MASPIALYKTPVSAVAVGGQAVTAMFGPVQGGFITNPWATADEGIAIPEPLYIDPTGAPATLGTSATTIALQPGDTYIVIPGQLTNVSVNARSSGHRFTGIVYQPATPFPPTPQAGTFPPTGPTTLTQAIPSYLYEQYADDDDLQAFVAAYNGLAQQYVTWFATIGLPVYTSTNISGSLLDWIAQGLYGIVRPSLSSGRNRDVGPYNTVVYNTLAYNRRRIIGPSNITFTSDDIFRRIITWNFYKGDGNKFNVRWLKRRIMRFLIGVNGTAPNIDNTYLISITFGAGNVVSIRLPGAGTRSLTGGALYNRFRFNTMAYNAIRTNFTPGSPNPFPDASVLKQAIDSGVLQLPFQFQVSVSI